MSDIDLAAIAQSARAFTAEKWTPELRALAKTAQTIGATLADESRVTVRVLSRTRWDGDLALVHVTGEGEPRWIAASRLDPHEAPKRPVPKAPPKPPPPPSAAVRSVIAGKPLVAACVRERCARTHQGEVRAAEVADALGITIKHAATALRELSAHGALQRRVTREHGARRVYYRPAGTSAAPA